MEDNPTTRKLFRVALEAEGYRVLEASDGRRRWLWSREQAPDLVLMDLVLPDIDGLALALQLRALPVGQALPIVAVSGFRRLLDRAALEPGAFNEVLLKPVDLEQLLRRGEPLRGQAQAAGAAKARALRAHRAGRRR